LGKLFVAILVNYWFWEGLVKGWRGEGLGYELAGDILASLLSERVFGADGVHLVSIYLQLNIEAGLMLSWWLRCHQTTLICHGLRNGRLYGRSL
jgi:hypothetical protein